jgi:HlyD family secretion protein
MKKPATIWILVTLAVAAIGIIIFLYWNKKRNELPKGFASGNGRIEANLVDIASKEPLKVDSVLVAEGDLVKPGQVLAKLNTETLNAQLAEASANVKSVLEKVAIAEAAIKSRKSEINLARTEAKRSQKLFKSGAGSQREYDVRQKDVATTTAALAEEEARLKSAQKDVEVAEANVATVQTRIKDATLISPVTGRVLYRLTEPGEVLAAGGKALTLVDLSDVYMEIFLPSNQAAAVKIENEARLTLDYLPGWAIPAKVTFVSPEAQFTPKQVETRSEREMLMFRTRLQIPQELVLHYIEQIKTGVRGVGYVKIDEYAQWPEELRNVLTVEKSNSIPPAK